MGKGTTQYAALPWRAGEALEVLLITSRGTGRWIVPKGWPMDGKAPHEAAAQEAFEEAGVTGAVGDRPLGLFHYDKVKRSGKARATTVIVFPLAVSAELDAWPEAHERTRRWFTPEEAAALVDEPELAQIIRRFSP